MSEHSKIEWTEATWNPVTGCTKVSPGCAHCYAERITNRFGGPGAFDKVVLHPSKLELPLHWKKPKMIFVNSMSDLFHEAVPDEFIDKIFAIMMLRSPGICKDQHGTPEAVHTFQVLTKRAKRMRDYLHNLEILSSRWTSALEEMGFEGESQDAVAYAVEEHCKYGVLLPNVWLGVSVENQRMADERIPLLLQTPATVRWLSVEPLLAPVDLAAVHLGGWIYRKPGIREPERFNVLQARTVFYDEGDIDYPKIDWVVVGGESGPQARPMHLAWARALRDQCIAAGVPFFFKQWGGWIRDEPFAGGDLGGDMRRGIVRHVCLDRENDGHFRRGDMYMRRVGKKKGGRLLDGREWNQYPPTPSGLRGTSP